GYSADKSRARAPRAQRGPLVRSRGRPCDFLASCATCRKLGGSEDRDGNRAQMRKSLRWDVGLASVAAIGLLAAPITHGLAGTPAPAAQEPAALPTDSPIVLTDDTGQRVSLP